MYKCCDDWRVDLLAATTVAFLQKPCRYRNWCRGLHSIRKQFVELGDFGGDTVIDGAISDLDNESTQDLGIDLMEQNLISKASL